MRLTADDAEIHAATARVEGDQERNIGYWVDASDTVSWPAKITHPGLFRVEVVQACPEATAGTEYTLSVGDQTVSCKVAATGSWRSYKTVPVDKIKIDQDGSLIIELVAGKLKGFAVMNLRACGPQAGGALSSKTADIQHRLGTANGGRRVSTRHPFVVATLPAPVPFDEVLLITGGTSIADDLTRYFQLDDHAGKEQQDVKPFRDQPRG